MRHADLYFAPGALIYYTCSPREFLVVVVKRLVKMLLELVPPEVYYCLHQGACVFAGICLLVRKIIKKVMDGFQLNFYGNVDHGGEELMIQFCQCSQLPSGSQNILGN